MRIFPDPKTGLFQIEWRENGRRLTRSLRHRDWTRAKRQADEFAAGFARPEPNGEKAAEPEPLTLERLFDIYGEEVTPAKGAHTRQHDRTSMQMFLRFFGRHRDPATLSQRDWDRFIRERRAGRIGPSGKPVSDRTVEYDLKFLIAVLNWGAKSRDERGRLLLDRNPLRGLRTPSEKNPTRVVLAEEEYRALLKVSRRVDWRFRAALVLAHETGQHVADNPNHRKKPHKFNGDCTICHSCRYTDIQLRRTPEAGKPGRIAGIRIPPHPGVWAPRHSEWVGVDERLRILDVPPMLSGDPQHSRRTTP